MNRQYQIQNTRIYNLALHIKEVAKYVDDLLFTHIYHQHNTMTGNISKAGLVEVPQQAHEVFDGPRMITCTSFPVI